MREIILIDGERLIIVSEKYRKQYIEDFTEKVKTLEENLNEFKNRNKERFLNPTLNDCMEMHSMERVLLNRKISLARLKSSSYKGLYLETE